MSLNAEIARMEAEGFHYTLRDARYKRKRDGAIVIAVDWPDGDVTWCLDPIPIIPRIGNAIGTCSNATFDRAFTRLDVAAIKELDE